ncbi:MAG: peroxidase family protein, partial [Methyloligellaceae bacterium]
MYRVLSYIFRVLNRIVIWHRLPIVMSVINLIVLRYDLRRKNLFDTSRNLVQAPDLKDFDIRGFRTADGSYNDLSDPAMGKENMRFGRNVPLKYTYGEKDEDLLTPNPRVISNQLLARKEFLPVPHLNVHAASWLQFMTHDWFSHGNNDPDPARQIHIPVPEGDDWGEADHQAGHISVRATLADDIRGEVDEGTPATFRNRE